MRYEVQITKKALKQLRAIPKPFNANIFAAIRKLENTETWGDVKRLTDHEYKYRLCVGNYRVLFDTEDDVRILEVQEVKKRDERTY